jgi:hypothetical protein
MGTTSGPLSAAAASAASTPICRLLPDRG